MVIRMNNLAARFIPFVGIALVMASASAMAQDSMPPLNPPDASWPTPSPGEAPPPGAVPPPPPLPGMDGNPPVPPPGFESFDFGGEDDGYGGGGYGGSAGSAREGKSSFKMVSPQLNNSCNVWGNEMLGNKVFDNYGSCSFALEKLIDKTRADINEVFDKFERQKLKTVIKGNLNRKEAEAYVVDFPKLRNQLGLAAKQGCTCKK